MSKYDKFEKALSEKKAYEKKQLELHKKYDNVDEDKVIVEKKNLLVPMLRFTAGFMRCVFSVAVILLCTVGIICLVYPQTRDCFFLLLTDIVNEMREYL